MAMDRSESRLRALTSSSEAAGLEDMITVSPGDLREYAAWAAERRAESGEGPRRPRLPLLYDKVLVDAPCSGTGVLAKRADLRWRRTREQLQGGLAPALCAIRLG